LTDVKVSLHIILMTHIDRQRFRVMPKTLKTVVAAQAAIQWLFEYGVNARHWIPACAGTTVWWLGQIDGEPVSGVMSVMLLDLLRGLQST
jgi:hypothetical protein